MLIVFLLILSIVAFEPTFAQTTPTVPQFTCTFVNNSYNVQPTYGIDPYTGKTVVETAGYFVVDQSLIMSIKNQPFSSTSNGKTLNLYYLIQTKGHYTTDWSNITYSVEDSEGDFNTMTFFPASDSSYTDLTFGLGGNNATNTAYNGNSGEIALEVPPGGQIDLRVQAFIGYSSTTETVEPIFQNIIYNTVWTGQTSEWSDAQTLTTPGIPQSNTSPSSSATPTSPSSSTASPSATSVPNSTVSATYVPLTTFVTVVVTLAVVFGLAIAFVSILLYRKIPKSSGQK